jgi:hypothetical protein
MFSPPSVGPAAAATLFDAQPLETCRSPRSTAQSPRHTIFVRNDLLADVTFDTACFTARPCPKDPDSLALHLRSQPSWGFLLHYYRPEPCPFAFQVWESGSRAFRRGQWDAAEALSIQESLGLTVNGRRHSAMHPTSHQTARLE